MIDNSILPIEAGGATIDIDADGDLDVVMGADNRGNQVWWWENPYPDYADAIGRVGSLKIVGPRNTMIKCLPMLTMTVPWN